jgi:hypothetical protein
MKRSLSPLERALSTDANASRRDPPARLRASILGRLDAEPAPRVETETVRERSRVLRPLLAVAAAVLIAGLAWLALRSGAPSPAQTVSGASATSSRTNGIELALTSLRPGAIDDPLLAEAQNLSHDTTRATRYLIDRVSMPFLPRTTPR